jgi:hypothetical protein
MQQALEFLMTRRLGAEVVIEALNTALAQPEQKPVSCRFCHSKKGCWAWQCYHCGEIDDVQQPPLLPKQEPVGKVVEVNNDGFKCEFSQHLAVGTKLYTAPPASQRPWVGLTDEEIAQGNKESWVTEQAWQSAVWWAEAKLKEKNNG